MAKYQGDVAACYINTSKKGKKYCTGFIRLPDANGNITSYKFLVFEDNIVAQIEGIDPVNLKGKKLTLEGDFKENTWNGKSEYQLMVSTIEFPEDVPTPSQTTPTPNNISNQETAPSVPVNETSVEDNVGQDQTQMSVPNQPTQEVPPVPGEAPVPGNIPGNQTTPTQTPSFTPPNIPTL